MIASLHKEDYTDMAKKKKKKRKKREEQKMGLILSPFHFLSFL
jgi:hypothetical protein